MVALLSIPSPLHPAVVHFPIVLLLLGAVVALVAAFLPRARLPLIAAVFLGLGAIGSVVAVQTGKQDGELVQETPAIERVLEQHEAWAERTQTASIVAALLAIGAIAVTRWPVAARVLNFATTLGAIAAMGCVIETGHYGGQLVYQHGAGVNTVSAASGTTQAEQPATKTKKGHTDND